MDDFQDLYQETLLDHSSSPRNAQLLQNPSCHSMGRNPLCGDCLCITATVQNNQISDVGFKAKGCVISVACASLMSEAVKNKTVPEFYELFDAFHTLVIKGDTCPLLEKNELNVFSGIKRFPGRVKCATLAWHTLKAAVEKTFK